jgi:hypothetical protein
MCPNLKIKRGRGHMPWNVFKKIVDECKEFEGRGISFILHKDGEPLMDKMLFDRIDYIKKVMKKSRVHFNTNAMLLNEEKILKILNSPLDSITFSVDAVTPETYEQIRIGLNYNTVKNNVLNFFRMKKDLNKDIHVTMQMVVNEMNMHETEEYKKMWREKADRVFCKSTHNFLVQKSSIYGDRLSEKQLKRCLMPFLAMLFYWNGDIGLCCWDYDHMVDLGNIENQSLLQLYNTPMFERIREAMKKKDCKNIRPCNICSQIYGEDGPYWQ